MIERGRSAAGRRGEPAGDRRPRLKALADQYALGEAATEQLDLLLQLLLSDPLAPTAIRDPTKAIDDHLADSLIALELEVVRSAHEAADIGSGAGLPGLPLAIALPRCRFVLVESAARKCAFLERAVVECGVSNATVVHARAEAWPEGVGRHDLVTARAVGPVSVVAEYAAPLLRVGGTVVVWRGRRDADADAASARAAQAVGLSEPEIIPVRPYEGAHHRHLYLMSKVMKTPREFPRRPGIALKRPLGSGPGRGSGG